MADQSDRQLVEASQQGCREAYAELIRRHARRVYAICLGLLGSPHDAEDLAQEALLKGFTRIDLLQDPDRFAPWIARIARNGCLDWMRRRRRRPENTVEDLNQMPTPDADRHRDLHEAVRDLPEKYRMTLLLYYFAGHDTESVARTLGISAATVFTRLSRARLKLREILADKENSI